MTIPTMLDEPARNPRALIQWIDVNGDGLPDIVRSERHGGTNNSTTWLATGRGFHASPSFGMPLDAIADRDGDPEFRLVDVNGDGLPDAIVSRLGAGNALEQRLWLNTGAAFKAAADDVVSTIPVFVDADGNDQGVRFFDVNADGLLDVLQSYATGPSNEVAAAQILLNAGGRADMLARLSSGYGLRTEVSYQPMGKPLNSPAKTTPWRLVYQPADGAVLYPLIRPVPAAYLVSLVLVTDQTGAKLPFSYRYGSLLFDAQEMKSLGFGWREAYNESTGILDRTEFNQSRELTGHPTRTTSCWLEPAFVASAPGGANLCATSGNNAQSHLLRAVDFSWHIDSGAVGPSLGEQSNIFEVVLKSSNAREWEFDGGLVSRELTNLQYVGEASYRHPRSLR